METVSKFALKTYTSDVNFGDLLSIEIVRNLLPNSNIKIIDPYCESSSLNLVALGSILFGADVHSRVWGAGFLFGDSYLRAKPHLVASVRGPLSDAKLIRQGLQGVKNYGDPGHLVKEIYPEPESVQFKFGFVPHFYDKGDERLNAISTRDDTLIIDVQREPWKVLSEIKRCEVIVSSSLHGLICADAFEIPSVWMRLSSKVPGGSFKFIDYFMSCGRKDHEPLLIGDEIDFNKILAKREFFRNLLSTRRIIDAFPFH